MQCAPRTLHTLEPVTQEALSSLVTNKPFVVALTVTLIAVEVGMAQQLRQNFVLPTGLSTDIDT